MSCSDTPTTHSALADTSAAVRSSTEKKRVAFTPVTSEPGSEGKREFPTAPTADSDGKAAAGSPAPTSSAAAEAPAEGERQKSPPPSSPLKLGGRFVHCKECGVDIPLADWPNHRDRLRTVSAAKATLSLVQLYILNPLLSLIMWVLVTVFFREVAVVGQENIPKKGAVIFYGNHQNQFIDAMMMRAHCKRNVRFIIAEKSMNRPVIGHFARLMQAVPAVRPQDVGSTQGPGKLVSVKGNVVTGAGTTFTSTLSQGDVVIWTVPTKKERCQGQVWTIASDTELTLTQVVAADDEVVTGAASGGTTYKYSKRIDHSDMYASVYSTFQEGDAIGIFPEGGSHDRTSMMPLKAGVALFTLGAAERGIDVQIVPVGLTYFYGHKFRSRAHIEFGNPFSPPRDLVESFDAEKRTTTTRMLDELSQHLHMVTINVADWPTLKFLHSLRRLYQPPGLLLETKDYLRLTRRLALIIAAGEKDEDFADFRNKVENYADLCSALLIRDSQAATLSQLEEQGNTTDVLKSLRLLFRRIVMLCVLTVVLLPFFIFGGPIGIITHVLAEGHARLALSQSSIKVVAADVKASYKIVLGFALVPLECFVVATLTYMYSDWRTALTVFFSLPVVLHVSLVILREWVMEMNAALPLVMSIMSKHKQFVKLAERRKKLVAMTKRIVNQYDPALEKELGQYGDQAAESEVARVRQASLFSLRHQSRISKKDA